MSDQNLINLLQQTEDFFENHWNRETLGESPTWSNVFSDFVRMPNYLKAGVYAFIKNSEITYIGVGASKGGGIYTDRGLSRRFQSYIKVDKLSKKLYIIDYRLKEADGVVTIGFDSQHAYLAYGLEAFLISKINPIYNKIGRKK